MFADSVYRACLFWGVWFARVVVLLVRKPSGQRGFVVQSKQWVVERTFAWLGRRRRLLRDHERTCECSKGFVTVAMIWLVARRLPPPGG